MKTIINVSIHHCYMKQLAIIPYIGKTNQSECAWAVPEWGQGVQTPESHENIGFLRNTGLYPMKITKLLQGAMFKHKMRYLHLMVIKTKSIIRLRVG